MDKFINTVLTKFIRKCHIKKTFIISYTSHKFATMENYHLVKIIKNIHFLIIYIV